MRIIRPLLQINLFKLKYLKFSAECIIIMIKT